MATKLDMTGLRDSHPDTPIQGLSEVENYLSHPVWCRLPSNLKQKRRGSTTAEIFVRSRLEAFRDFVFDSGIMFLHATWDQPCTASRIASDRETCSCSALAFNTSSSMWTFGRSDCVRNANSCTYYDVFCTS